MIRIWFIKDGDVMPKIGDKCGELKFQNNIVDIDLEETDKVI